MDTDEKSPVDVVIVWSWGGLKGKEVTLDGDEEEAGREEGCPEEKEVKPFEIDTLGAAPPSGTHTLFYVIRIRQERIVNILFVM